MYIYIYAYLYTDIFTVPEKELYLKLKKLYTNPKQTLNQPLLATSSAAQGGGGSFKNRKPIGEVGCCESPMAERVH